jgi:hypothetical protein
MTVGKRIVCIALATVAIVIASPATSQCPGGGNSGRGGMGGKGSEGMRSGTDRGAREDASAAASVAAVVTFRLDQLEDDLQLTPAQRVPWKTYRDGVMKMADDAMRAQRSFATGDLTAPQRMDRLLDVARNRLTAMEDVVDSGKRLYAMLTPAQQLVADRRMAVAVMPVAGVEAGSAGMRPPAPRGAAEPARAP